MSTFLPFIIIGLVSGSVYGLAGIGLVMTYKTSGIFNFAYGSIAAVGTFVFYFLRQQHHVPWPIALVLCTFVLGPILGLLLGRLAKSLGPADTTIKVLGTIGLVLIVLSLGVLWFPGNVRTVDSFLPTHGYSIAGTNVGWDQTIIFVFAVLVTVVLSSFFRYTRMGLSMRAVVDNSDLVSRTGLNPVTVRRWAWIIGTSLAVVSGILLAPSLNLDPLILTMLVVQAFGAAAIGTFSSLPVTFIGGLVLGVADALATKYTANFSFLSGLSAGLPFIVLFVVLVLTPRARLMERAIRPMVQVHRSWEAPWLARSTAGALAVGFLITVPLFAGIHLVAYSSFLVAAILFLSLGVLVRTSGQVSLCHYGFAAVGAVATAHFASSFGVPWLLAILLGSLMAVPIGAFIALPAIRLSGVFLALATLGFGILLEQMFYPMRMMFGTSANGVAAPRPGGGIGGWHFGTDRGFYYVILLFGVLTAIAVELVRRGRLGRLLRALGDSPIGLQTHGTTVTTTRILVFCISAFFAGLSGGLTASLFHYAVSTEFVSFSSLTLFAALVIITVGAPWYALIAAAGLYLVPSYLTGSNTSTYLQLLFGIGAVTYVYVARKPPEVPDRVRHFVERISAMHKRPSVSRPVIGLSPVLASEHAQLGATVPTGAALEIKDLTVTYGGLLAVQNLSLKAAVGQITGLIGPNGAGKTSTFNACCGLVRPRSGTVTLGDRDITNLSTQRRARLGLGRTFQRIELFDSLTVRENVEMGVESALAAASPWSQLVAKHGEKATIRSRASDAIVQTGIASFANIQSGLLTIGQRRLVELAVALAGSCRVLLLDEPSSGLDEKESERFGEILRRTVVERSIGILLVEHDMTLVRQVCDHVYVMDFGTEIFHGTVAEMEGSELVKAAYLGTDDAAVATLASATVQSYDDAGTG